MNYRLKSIKVPELLLTMAVIAALAFAMHGCSSGGGSGGSSTGSVQLSGTVGSGYTAAKASNSFFAKALSILGLGSPAYAVVVDPTVDKVVAIPMDRGSLRAASMGNSVSSTIDPGTKAFSLSLAKDHDWLLVLIDSSQTGTNRFVGSLAFNTGSDSLLNLPATDATITLLDLGVVTRPSTTSNDALSAATVTAVDFNMTAGQLATMAQTDDVFRNAKNIVGNYDSATGTYYQMRFDSHWSGAYSTLSATFSNPAYTSIGTSFQLDSNSTEVTINDICNQTKTLTIFPSAPVSNGVATFDSSNPFTSSGVTCGPLVLSTGTFTQTTGGGSIYASSGYGNVSYGPQGRFDSTLLPAVWTLKLDGVDKAQFDMSGINPSTSDGKPKGYIPSFKMNVTGTTIDSVDVEWYYYDEGSASYIKLAPADLKLLKHSVERLEVKFDVTYLDTRKTCEMYFDPTTTTQVSPSDPTYGCADTWYYGDPSHPATNTSLMGFYESGGIGYFFDFFMP
jgi:hypothetical protein